MATLYLLGTGAAVSDPHRTTTMLAVENGSGLVLIDCGGDAFQRLLAAGADTSRLLALVITHEHADHVSGFPLLMEKLWLAGRREPLDVYGIAPAIAQARRVHDSFDTSAWPGYPEIRYHEVAQEDGAKVLEVGTWEISASPGAHAVPVVGLRVHDQEGGGVAAYSCDTEYSPAIVRMSRGATILVHEATGSGPGHAGAAEAAQAAAAAEAGRLLLVHLPPAAQLGDEELAAARRIFPATELGEEGGSYRF